MSGEEEEEEEEEEKKKDKRRRAFYVSPTWINEFQLNLSKLTSYRTDQSSQHRQLVSVQM